MDETCGAVFTTGDMPAFEQSVRSVLRGMEDSEQTIRVRSRAVAEQAFAPSTVANGLVGVFERVTKAQGRQPRLLVVSHACVIDVNQSVYRELRERGWGLRLIVPSTWRHEYADGKVRPSPLSGLEDSLQPLPIFLPGRPQRHGYLTRPSNAIRQFRPDVIFLEQEPFSLPALQWGVAASRAGIPFGVQMDENLDRPFPLPARLIRRWILPRASFIAARSPTAAELGRSWGATGAIGVAPHAVPTWTNNDRDERRLFTIGFAGRLIPAKGIDDLLAAVQQMRPPLKLLVAGAGPLQEKIQAAATDGLEIELLTGLSHERMGEVLARMDVLVLPSRTTATWAEQFGRVLVEAMSQRVPVVGSSSGEIPWVIETTGGGLTFEEGNVAALLATLVRLRDDPGLRAELGVRGSESVDRIFAVGAAADSLEALIRGAIP
jgi:glycosyltransferase involved in cell wall biosynthesis